MKYWTFLLLVTMALTGRANYANKHLSLVRPLVQQPGGKTGIEVKWAVFWKDFVAAIHEKDTIRIATLSSKDFYDGGGSTVEQWLDAEVFIDDKHFLDFKTLLKKGVHAFKGYNGTPYKASGKNKSGDLFFEYSNKQWVFGGLVGD